MIYILNVFKIYNTSKILAQELFCRWNVSMPFQCQYFNQLTLTLTLTLALTLTCTEGEGLSTVWVT